MSKHGDKHEDRTALFPSPGHLIRGLVGFFNEKTIRYHRFKLADEWECLCKRLGKYSSIFIKK